VNIKSIDEFFNQKLDNSEYQYNSYYDGFRVETDQGSIILAISSSQDCCENFGTVSSADDFADFIGSTILEIKTTGDLITKSVEFDVNYMEEGGYEFITLETTKGTLQFVVYNMHNGYYGHAVVIEILNSIDYTSL